MARWAPCKRIDFIRKLRALGFSQPEPGGRHFYMRYGEHTMTIPNNPEFSVPPAQDVAQAGREDLGEEDLPE